MRDTSPIPFSFAQRRHAQSRRRYRWRPGLTLLGMVALVLVTWPTVVSSNPGLGDQPSHLGAHSPLPPEALMHPLAEPDDSVIKGYSPAPERRLAAALGKLDLHQRLLKVAVGEAVGRRMGLIKLQASDQESGVFRVADLESDAVAALRAGFATDRSLCHLDLWSVVPGGEGPDGEVHATVFSVSTTREAFLQADSQGLTPRQLLGKLGPTRYAPLFLRYAADDPVQLASTADLFPAAAFTADPAADGWQRYVQESATVGAGTSDKVQALLRGPADQNQVAITIDDGPHPLLVPLMLAVLDRLGVKATFFVVGQMAEQYPALVREIAADGHELGNHTYWHRRLSGLSEPEAAAEIRACSAVVSRITGQQPRFLRPPGGDFSETSLQAIAQSGLTMALWTQNAGDWRKSTARQIADRALAQARPGAIILMHDGDLNSVDALGMIIVGLRQRGLQPVPLSELASQGAMRDYPVNKLMSYLDSGWKPEELR